MPPDWKRPNYLHIHNHHGQLFSTTTMCITYWTYCLIIFLPIWRPFIIHKQIRIKQLIRTGDHAEASKKTENSHLWAECFPNHHPEMHIQLYSFNIKHGQQWNNEIFPIKQQAINETFQWYGIIIQSLRARPLSRRLSLPPAAKILLSRHRHENRGLAANEPQKIADKLPRKSWLAE